MARVVGAGWPPNSDMAVDESARPTGPTDPLPSPAPHPVERPTFHNVCSTAFNPYMPVTSKDWQIACSETLQAKPKYRFKPQAIVGLAPLLPSRRSPWRHHHACMQCLDQRRQIQRLARIRAIAPSNPSAVCWSAISAQRSHSAGNTVCIRRLELRRGTPRASPRRWFSKFSEAHASA